MSTLKNLKLITLALILVVSIYLVASSFVEKKYGVVVTEINLNNTCLNVKVGDTITQMSGTVINNVNDFNKFVSDIKSSNYVNMVVGGEPANCVAIADGDLGVQVKNIKSGALKFGTDIAGGSIFIFKPADGTTENDLDGITKIIEKRIKFFELPQTKVYKDGNLIKIESSKDADFNRLIMDGKIDAKIVQEIKLENGTAKIKIGSEYFPIKVNDKINVNGVNYSLGETFKINNISFNLLNSTRDFVLVSIEVYSNKDINYSQTYFGAVKKVSKGVFQFTEPIRLTTEASNRFSLITRGMGVSYQPGKEAALSGKIIFYMNDLPVSMALDIPVEFAGKEIGVFIGFEKTEVEANKQMKNVEAALAFGQLPGKLALVKEEEVNRKVGIFDFEILFATLVASFIVCTVISQMRYKKINLGIHMVLLCAAELICIFGIVVFFQRFSSYNMNIDFSMFVGLVASALFTTAKMMVSAEESVKKLRLDIMRKYKKIIGAKNLLNVCLIVISLSSFFFGYGGFGSALLIGLVINVLLTNLIYRDLLKKSVG